VSTTAATPPRLARDTEHKLLGGVCSGIARRLGIDPIIVRVAVIGAATTGVGIVAYLLAWVFIPTADGTSRPIAERLAGQPGTGRVVAGVTCLVLALLLGLRELGLWFSDTVVWPPLLAVAGGALVWIQSTMRAQPAVERTGPRAPLGASEAPARQPAADLYRGGFGAALIVGAGLLFLNFVGALDGARDAVLGIVVVVLSIGLILLPFWLRLARSLAAERSERIRSQERAEVAAHLHDSVLQTLALVQRRADDPRAVATLARKQERELRTWLRGSPAARPDERLADALSDAGSRVEEDFEVHVEVVAVGDRALDEPGRALVAAAQEALVNAAKFAGDAGPVSVYAEIADDRVQVFVRDRGPGFDLAAVPEDRRGVRESILGRMTRHGGQARIQTAPGGGTEVELLLEERS
jgi:signal transduction histidine kinase/phage shock protein PspC (stress-responsive transcriptional regulator)